jgi:hypothetical protein
MTSYGDIGEKIQQILSDQKAENPHFMSWHGRRCCQYFVDVTDAAKLPSIAEPWWLAAGADVEAVPALGGADFAKAQPDIAAAVKKYG